MDSIERLFDPFGIGSSFLKVQEAWMQNPAELMRMFVKLNSDLQSISTEQYVPLLLDSVTPKETPEDPEVAFLSRVRNYAKLSQKVHAIYSNWLRDYVNNSGLNGKEKECSAFWANQLISALAPYNYFWTNPTAVQKCMRTKGESLAKGLKNWLEDNERGDNLVKIADLDAFKVGENIATTPGHVVYRNELVEVIQYKPTTEATYAVPLVLIQPWINKYYLFDLEKEKSFVRYLLDQGFTVFITSWKNPTREMSHIGFEDYMLKGALKAVDVAKAICNVEQVHAAGLCIGGTALAALMAWLNGASADDGGMPIAHWSLFATMVDYSEPGELGVFINDATVDEVDRLMEKDGYLDSKYMSMIFRLLRPDNLIWRYHAHNYLQGEMPPKSDFLYWNSDSTRLPKAMGSFYLREFYLQNKLAKKDAVVLADRPIDLGRIQQPLYVVGAQQDHICPWEQTFKTCNLVSGPTRYALAEEGHIAGVVNPPSPRSKKKYWSGEVVNGVHPDEWLSSREAGQGSWWTDWVGWLSERCGAKEKPPAMGNEKYPPMDEAPGIYVKES